MSALPEQTDTPQAQPGPFDDIKEWDDVPARAFFSASPEDEERFKAYITRINQLKPESVPVIMYDGDMPDGYSVAVLMVQETRVFNVTDDKGATSQVKRRVVTHVMVHPQPTLAILTSTEAGKAWVAGEIQASCAAKILRPLRNKDGEDFAAAVRSLPVSITDFIETQAREGTFKVFYAYAGKLLQALRKQNPKNVFLQRLTPQMLRDCLASAAAARQLAEALEEKGYFVKLIGVLKASAERDGASVSLYDEWLAERDKDEGDLVDEFDLDALEGLTVEAAEKKTDKAPAPAPATA